MTSSPPAATLALMPNPAKDGTIGKLRELASNLWWTWRPDVRGIFRDLDNDLYQAVQRNPISFLKRCNQAKIEERAHGLEVHARIDRALRQLHEYLAPVQSWGLVHAGALQARPVAYFCAEFGIHESLPIYSGGLGVLAGDHLKAASDLAVPLVGVGLLYHQGYTEQKLDQNFWQQDVIEPFDMADLPVEPARDAQGNPVRVHVDLPGRRVFVRVLEVHVGRVRLLLLDSRDEQNSEQDRALVARLYGGDQRTRIQQEMLLGVGGARALRALGITASVFHLNEGHSAFAIIERARHRAQEDGIPPWDALREAAQGTVFTTHTPVDAGHDRFPPEMAAEHLGQLGRDLGISVHDTIGLGRVDTNDHGAPFMPTVLALKFSRRANGVAALHGVVSRRMWQGLWPGRREEEVPIGHVTNGVHAPTWMAPEIQDLFTHHFGARWLERITHPDLWTKVEDIDAAEMWEVLQVLKARTLRFVGKRVGEMRARLGLPPAQPLDPDALTIGFARRFATYKRADLLLADVERLAALVNDAKRPVNFVFAGRAHPADHPGKTLIQKIGRMTEDPRFRGRIAFVEGYNMQVGRFLTQGVDVWLNNPRRPEEACGTSGQKVILNGGMHCSILDGWWAEAYDGANGFALGTGETHARHDVQDKRDADELYRVIAEEVVPLYYDRDARGTPRRWIARVKRSMRTLAWRFNADRMVIDYVNQLYLPAAVASSCIMPPA